MNKNIIAPSQFFVQYPLHKFILTLSFSYLCIWNLSVLVSYHFLSADYVRVRLVHFFSFFLFLHAVETFFRTIFLCLRVVFCPVSFCLHNVFNYFHFVPDFFFVWPNLNHIFNNCYPSYFSIKWYKMDEQKYQSCGSVIKVVKCSKGNQLMEPMYVERKEG